jgi:hypothetical protein
MTIPGVGPRTAETILTEVGVDMSRFPLWTPPCGMGWRLPWQQRERRETQEWADAQRQSLAARIACGGGATWEPHEILPWRTASPLGRPPREQRASVAVGHTFSLLSAAALAASTKAARSHLLPCPAPSFLRLPALSLSLGQTFAREGMCACVGKPLSPHHGVSSSETNVTQIILFLTCNVEL